MLVDANEHIGVKHYSNHPYNSQNRKTSRYLSLLRVAEQWRIVIHLRSEEHIEFANKLLIHVICNITFYLLFALRFYGYYTTADPTTPAGDILTISISQKYNTTIGTFYLFVHTFSISNRKSKSYDNAKCIIWRKNISLYCGTIFHKKSQTR